MKTLRRFFAAMAIVTLSMVAFTACIDDEPDHYWWHDPGAPWNFQDGRLTGYWALVQYNSEPVYANESNYLYFNGDSYGRYFYLKNGGRYVEQIRYWCQESNSAMSNYQINIQYEYSSPVTMNYWFTNSNTLWMQWTTNSGRVITSVYDRINRAPW